MKNRYQKLLRTLPMAAAGLANGLFGTGGGLLVLPLLRKQGLSPNAAAATAPAIVWPMCAVSAGVYLLRGDLQLAPTLWASAGLAAGAMAGGLWLKHWKGEWLDGLLAALLCYTGLRLAFWD